MNESMELLKWSGAAGRLFHVYIIRAEKKYLCKSTRLQWGNAVYICDIARGSRTMQTAVDKSRKREKITTCVIYEDENDLVGLSTDQVVFQAVRVKTTGQSASVV